MALVEAVTSVLKAANEFRDQAAYEKEGSTLIDKKIEMESSRDHRKELKYGLMSSIDNTLGGDWNLHESDDDSECIFPFSLPTRNDAWNGKLLSVPLLHGANMHGKEPHGLIASTKKDYKKKTRLTAIFEGCEVQQEPEQKRWGKWIP
ncbi:uncharacterized protein PAC_02013 [Phialocephala subalpina]|uniref:Uncharacterized protein n=1 Tax=Phialocephala subalpina TaxID=576137 RepID=A0A1L7WH77_9HELO|nr:uncharacterized protein PAC_02013 [Phialocephala subalpina]